MVKLLTEDNRHFKNNNSNKFNLYPCILSVWLHEEVCVNISISELAQIFFSLLISLVVSLIIKISHTERTIFNICQEKSGHALKTQNYFEILTERFHNFNIIRNINPSEGGGASCIALER